MFTFVGGPYTNGITTITAETMNYLRGTYSNALDVVDGGSWVAVTQSVITGTAGFKFNFSATGLQIGGLGGLHVLSGSTGYIDSGGFLVTNGAVTINSTFTVGAAGTITTNAASTTTLNGPLAAVGAATFSSTATFNGAASIGAAGLFTTNAAAASTFNGAVTLANVTSLTATQPASTTDVGANKLYATNTLRAYARFSTDGAGGVTVVDGVNIASATVDALDIIVTFAHAFANANYAATTSATSIGVIANPHTQTTTTMKIRQYDASLSATVNPSTDVGFVALTIGGRQ
jgi:hypothetical protein